MMTELERRALMGDKQAQQECTEKGIVLPCPKCYSEKLDIESDAQDIHDPETLGYLHSTKASIVYIACKDCGICSECEAIELGEEYEDAEKRLIAAWNTRAAPPVGRCKDCKLLKQGGASYGWCGDNPKQFEEFCSNFKPKE